MIIILNTQAFSINWHVLRGVSAVEENFSLSTFHAFLVSENNRIPCDSVSYDSAKGLVINVSAGLATGVYGLHCFWLKNGEYFKGARCIQEAHVDKAFAITDQASEATDSGDDICIQVKSQVGTYGYDGLDAYELAILRESWIGDEASWLSSKRGETIGTDEIKDKAITTDKLADDVKLDFESEITTETEARKSADVDLQYSINKEGVRADAVESMLRSKIEEEATARQNADNTLQGNIDAIKDGVTMNLKAKTKYYGGDSSTDSHTEITSDYVKVYDGDDWLAQLANGQLALNDGGTTPAYLSADDVRSLHKITSLSLTTDGTTAGSWAAEILKSCEVGKTISISISDIDDEEMPLYILGDGDTLLGTARVSSSALIEINANCGHGYFHGNLLYQDNNWKKDEWDACRFSDCATTSKSGLMSATDKVKLNGLGDVDFTVAADKKIIIKSEYLTKNQVISAVITEISGASTSNEFIIQIYKDKECISSFKKSNVSVGDIVWGNLSSDGIDKYEIEISASFASFKGTLIIR